MFQCNLDDLVASKVSPDRSVLAPFANDICLVSLLPVHGKTVLMTEDCYSLERQLVSGTENPNRDLASVGNENLVLLHYGAVRPETSVHSVGILVSVAVCVRRAIVALVVLLRVGHGEEEVNGSKRPDDVP